MFLAHRILIYGLIKNAQHINSNVKTHHLHQILLHPCSHTLHHLVSIALQWHHQSKTETVIHLDSIPSVEFSFYGLGKCAGWRHTWCPTTTEQKQAGNIRDGNDTPQLHQTVLFQRRQRVNGQTVSLTVIVPLPSEVKILVSSVVKQAANTSSFTDSVRGCCTFS